MLSYIASLVPALTALVSPVYGQPSAALWEDQLFVAVARLPERPSAFVYRGTFDPNRRRVRDPQELSNPSYLYARSTQAKLDIRDNRLLLLHDGTAPFIFPMTEVPLLEYSEFGNRLTELHGYKVGGTDHWDRFAGAGASILFPNHREPDVPAPLFYPDGTMVGFPNPTYALTARYDLQLGRPGTLRVFHAHKDRLFVSVERDDVPRTTKAAHKEWPVDGEMPRWPNRPKPPDRELRTGTLPRGFTDYFAAYTAADREYLVTNTGKVYLCVPKGKDTIEVTALWTDPKRRIVGVVQDLDNKAVYGWGFATASAAPERFHVKMDPKPVAVPYKLTVPIYGECQDAYVESYECARAFRKAQK